MPRIRSIKPEFWEDEKMGRVSRDARLLFICTWNLADDFGSLRGSPRFLRLQAFPYDDDLDDADVARMVNQLSRQGAVVIYEVRGELYLHIVNFERHQNQARTRKVSKFPDLSDSESRVIKQLQGFDTNKTGENFTIPDPIPCPGPDPFPDPQDPPSPTESHTPTEEGQLALATCDPGSGPRVELKELVDYYNEIVGRAARPVDSKLKRFKAMRNTFSMEELKRAVRGALIHPSLNHRDGSTYHDWDNVFRDDNRVESLIEAITNPPKRHRTRPSEIPPNEPVREWTEEEQREYREADERGEGAEYLARRRGN